MAELVVRSQRVVANGKIAPASIHITGGKIERVGEFSDAPADAIDYGDLAILPGIVDTHVHLNEPGRTEWEGFATATHAAAIGGVTTLVDMPLNSIPPTTTREGFAAKRAAARGQGAPSTSASGAASCRAMQRELAGMVADGVRGFKCFLVDSGVDEFGWVGETRALARDADPRGPRRAAARARRGRGPIDAADDALAAADPRKLRDVPRVASTGGRRAGDRARHAPVSRDARAHAHRASLGGERIAAAARRARAKGCRSRRRRARTICTSPPSESPTARRRSSARRRSATRRIARSCGRRSPKACSISSRAITRRARPNLKAMEVGDFMRRGAASRACSSRCRSCGPRRARAVTRSSTSRAG